MTNFDSNLRCYFMWYQIKFFTSFLACDKLRFSSSIKILWASNNDSCKTCTWNRPFIKKLSDKTGTCEKRCTRLLNENFFNLIFHSISCRLSAALVPGPTFTTKRVVHTDLFQVMIHTLLCRHWISRFRSVPIFSWNPHFVQMMVPWKSRKKYCIQI